MAVAQWGKLPQKLMSNPAIYGADIFSGIKTCILTNNWTNDLVKNFRSLPFPQLLHYFDEVFESCKIGLSKPDPDIYTHVCSKMGVQPSEVYIYLLLRM